MNYSFKIVIKMIKHLVIISIITFSCLASRHDDIISGMQPPNEEDYQSLYKEFVLNYKMEGDKLYSLYPDVERLEVFKDNVDRWQKHNSNPENTWKMGMTKFSDYTNAEFREIYNLDKPLGAP
jgi:hypothetical protein